MNDLEIFDFEEKFPLRVVRDAAGNPWFVASDVCDALALGNTAMATARLDADEKGVSSIDTLGGTQQVTTLNESGLYNLVLGSRKAEARRFKKWVTSKVLPSIRKTGTYSHSNRGPAVLAVQLAEAISDALRLEGSARLGVVQKAVALNAPEHLPLLPAYGVDAPNASQFSSEATASMSELLKEHGALLSAAKVNRVLADMGLLEQLTRGSSTKGTKTFWSITQRGLSFGKNLVSPSNPRETQPHWFRSRFSELVGLIQGREAA